MNEIKFACPHCGQHIACDAGYALQRIPCPGCQAEITVPAAAPQAATTPAYRPAAAAPVAPRTTHAATPQPQTSGLAVASLVCSISTLLIGIGFIPGIICGHIARKKIRETPGLGGDGLAKAGLICGYGFLALFVAGAVVLVSLFGYAFSQARTRAQARPSFPVQRAVPQASPVVADAGATSSGWTMNLSAAGIPSGPVAGKIHGQDFVSDKAKLENGILTLREGKEFFADRELMIFLFLKAGESLDGKIYEVNERRPDGATPHVYKKWKVAGKNVPDQKAFTSDYVMKIEFGTTTDGRLPGKFYLALPDEEKSFAAGTFTAELGGAAGVKKSAAPPKRKPNAN